MSQPGNSQREENDHYAEYNEASPKTEKNPEHRGGG
jgi:hypothetical protein